MNTLFITGKTKLVKTLLSLISLEARLAGLSIYPLILNLCFLIVILISSWLLTLVLSAYFLAYLLGNYPLALFLLLLINIGLLLGLVKYLSLNLNNMSFASTRAYLTKSETDAHGNHQERIENTDSPNRESITQSRKKSKKVSKSS